MAAAHTLAPQSSRAPLLPRRQRTRFFTHAPLWLSHHACLLPRALPLLQLMFKLRKELGDEDFKRIFEDPRVKGPKYEW